MAVAAVICAAGASARMGGMKKEYLLLPQANGLTVLGAAVSAFASVPEITSIVIAVPAEASVGEAAARNALPPQLLEGKSPAGKKLGPAGKKLGPAGKKLSPAVHFVNGGKTRQASVHNALLSLSASHTDYVLIHDGARPWVSVSLIQRIIETVKKHHAAIPIMPLVETPKETDAPLDLFLSGANTGPVFIKQHLRRATVGTAQTPQGFAFPQILDAHRQAALQDITFTDDAEIWASFCGPVAVIPGEIENRKITFAEDLAC